MSLPDKGGVIGCCDDRASMWVHGVTHQLAGGAVVALRVTEAQLLHLIADHGFVE